MKMFATALCALLLVGCAAIDRTLYKPGSVVQVAPERVITNTVLMTNYVILPPVTNEVTKIVEPPVIREIITPVITYDVRPAITRTNLEVLPAVEGTIQAVGALPVPYAGAAGMLLGWLYTGYRLVRNRRLAEALVTGVEAGRKFLKETPEGQKLDRVIRQKLEEHQLGAGVYVEASKLVNELTKPKQ